MSLFYPMGLTPLNCEIECKDEFMQYGDKLLQLHKGCGWKGLVKDTIIDSYSSNIESWNVLAGRQGVRYHCPSCNELLIDDIIKMS